MPMFYRNLIQVWLSTKSTQDKEQVQNWGDEVIWNNICIISRGKTLYYKEWAKRGILCISDLYDQYGVFHSLDEIKSRFSQPASVCIQYLALKQAILVACKNKQKNVTNKDIFFYDGKTFVALMNCTSKLYRKAMISKISTKPICQSFWEKKFENMEFNWSKIWKNVHVVKEPRLMTLNWKITSNIYATKVFLNKIGKEKSNVCEICNEVDYIEHFFFGCKKIKKIWSEVDKIILQHYNVNIKTTQADVIFGYYHAGKCNTIINKIISVSKLSISKYRYGKYPDLISLLHSELRIRKLM